ncbi:hypothetical protein [Afipia birgiae]|uniref:hypothetical protein n=1 Tax=Afipia birgiae TaxID=151414 RepID=UPI00030E690B|nr:hypothetical protein [Afipia birgiae]
MALHDILNKQDILNNQKLSNPIENEINKIFRWIRGITNIITNIEDLRVAIESTLAGNEPPVIERKAFGLLARHGGSKPKDSRLSKYANLVEFMDREWTRAIYNCHNRPKEGYEISVIMRPNADIPGATGEKFFIHPFIPWAW